MKYLFPAFVLLLLPGSFPVQAQDASDEEALQKALERREALAGRKQLIRRIHRRTLPLREDSEFRNPRADVPTTSTSKIRGKTLTPSIRAKIVRRMSANRTSQTFPLRQDLKDRTKTTPQGRIIRSQEHPIIRKNISLEEVKRPSRPSVQKEKNIPLRAPVRTSGRVRPESYGITSSNPSRITTKRTILRQKRQQLLQRRLGPSRNQFPLRSKLKDRSQ